VLVGRVVDLEKRKARRREIVPGRKIRSSAADLGASALKEPRSSHLRLVYVGTPVRGGLVSFVGWLASYGLTLSDLGHTPESAEAAARDFDAKMAAALEDRRLRRSRLQLVSGAS
jgi:hypothetical protein